MSDTLATLVGTRGTGLTTAPAVRRRRPVLTVALVVAGLAILGGLGQAAGLWKKLLPAGLDKTMVHTVARTTLSVTLKENGELKPVHSIELKCEVQAQGVKIEWVVDESTRVNKGDLLMRLASDEIKDKVEQEELELRKMEAGVGEAQENLTITGSENASKLKQVEVNLEVAELDLNRYMKGDYEKARTAANIEIKRAEMELARKQEELDKSIPLQVKGFVTQSKIRELQDEVERLKMARDKSHLELHILKEYEHTKNQKQKVTAVAQAREELQREKQRSASRETQAKVRVDDLKEQAQIRQKRLQRMKEQLAKCELVAPADGIVQYGGGGDGRYWGGNRVAPGEQVYPGQTLLTIPDTSQMMVTTRIHEADRHKLSDGLPCVVRVPAVPNRTFTGKVTKIAQFADSERSWWNPTLKEHAAEIRLDDNDAPLSPGETAEIEIMIEEVPDVLAVPVQCVFARGSKHFAFLHAALSTKPVEVQTGRGSTTMIEITAGLKAGDQVVLAPDERLLAMLPAPNASPGKPAAPATQSAAARP
jgi:RND family efflux transporter MFP subunit